MQNAWVGQAPTRRNKTVAQALTNHVIGILKTAYKRHIGIGALLLNVCFTLDLDRGTLGEAIDTNCHPNR